MSHRPLFPRVGRRTLGAILLFGTGACTGVVSLEPSIGPDEAVPAPELLGDWLAVDDEDTTWARISAGDDSTTYVLEFGDPITFEHVLPLGRPTFSLRVAPAGDRLFAEALPAEDDDALVDSLQQRYGSMVQLLYLDGLLKVVGDELHVWTFLGDSVPAALRGGRCPSPGWFIERRGVILSGAPRELRRTMDCLTGLPEVLDGPNVYHRVGKP